MFIPRTLRALETLHSELERYKTKTSEEEKKGTLYHSLMSVRGVDGAYRTFQSFASSVYGRQIEDVPAFSKRTRDALTRAGYSNLSDLLHVDLGSIKGLGESGRKQVIEEMAHRGYEYQKISQRRRRF